MGDVFETLFYRFQVQVNGVVVGVLVLNEILFVVMVLVAVSRYIFCVSDCEEEYKLLGIWIFIAAGFIVVIWLVGGEVMNSKDDRL